MFHTLKSSGSSRSCSATAVEKERPALAISHLSTAGDRAAVSFSDNLTGAHLSLACKLLFGVFFCVASVPVLSSLMACVRSSCSPTSFSSTTWFWISSSPSVSGLSCSRIRSVKSAMRGEDVGCVYGRLTSIMKMYVSTLGTKRRFVLKEREEEKKKARKVKFKFQGSLMFNPTTGGTYTEH